jgi:hypothetical protein
MQGMNSDCVKVCALLLALMSKVESCKNALNAQAVGDTLYGLHGMGSDSAEGRAMLYKYPWCLKY